jgi:hypothetical protein
LARACSRKVRSSTRACSSGKATKMQVVCEYSHVLHYVNYLICLSLN